VSEALLEGSEFLLFGGWVRGLGGRLALAAHGV